MRPRAATAWSFSAIGSGRAWACVRVEQPLQLRDGRRGVEVRASAVPGPMSGITMSWYRRNRRPVSIAISVAARRASQIASDLGHRRQEAIERRGRRLALRRRRRTRAPRGRRSARPAFMVSGSRTPPSHARRSSRTAAAGRRSSSRTSPRGSRTLTSGGPGGSLRIGQPLLLAGRSTARCGRPGRRPPPARAPAASSSAASCRCSIARRVAAAVARSQSAR